MSAYTSGSCPGITRLDITTVSPGTSSIDG